MKANEVIEKADVLVVGDRIAAVGPSGTLNVPAGARSIDATAKTILPGYVDIHAHMWTSWGVHRTQPWEYLANLAYGVTTTRDPQTMSTDVITLGDMVDAGMMVGPRILSTARGIFPGDDISSYADARNIVRRYGEFYHTGHDQAVPDRRPEAPPVDQHGREGIRPEHDDRSRRFPYDHDARARWLLRYRAHDHAVSAVQGCCEAPGGERHHLHAYADRYGRSRGVLQHAHEPVRGFGAHAIHAALGARRPPAAGDELDA
jgi:hypothetical protein